MDHPAQNLRGLPAADQATKCRKAVDAAASTDGAAIVGTPVPTTLTGLDTATDAVELKLTKVSLAEQALSVARNELLGVLPTMQFAYGQWVKNADVLCGGNAAKIASLGLDVAAKPGGSATMTLAPQNVLATMADFAGQVDVMWDPVAGSRSSIVQVCEDPMNDASWKNYTVVTSSKCVVTGLVSGKKYWFRVAAMGAGQGNQGPWSDPCQKMAP